MSVTALTSHVDMCPYVTSAGLAHHSFSATGRLPMSSCPGDELSRRRAVQGGSSGMGGAGHLAIIAASPANSKLRPERTSATANSICTRRVEGGRGGVSLLT